MIFLDHFIGHLYAILNTTIHLKYISSMFWLSTIGNFKKSVSPTYILYLLEDSFLKKNKMNYSNIIWIWANEYLTEATCEVTSKMLQLVWERIHKADTCTGGQWCSNKLAKLMQTWVNCQTILKLTYIHLSGWVSDRLGLGLLCLCERQREHGFDACLETWDPHLGFGVSLENL